MHSAARHEYSSTALSNYTDHIATYLQATNPARLSAHSTFFRTPLDPLRDRSTMTAFASNVLRYNANPRSGGVPFELRRVLFQHGMPLNPRLTMILKLARSRPDLERRRVAGVSFVWYGGAPRNVRTLTTSYDFE